jgi:osmotically-inducible protein OsmY
VTASAEKGGKIMKVGSNKIIVGLILETFLAAGMIAAAQEQQAAPQQPQMDKQKQEQIIRLINDVRKKLLGLTNYGPFDALSFGIGPGDKGYTVTLKGYASTPSLKESAEKVVKKIEAVDAVKNEIEVLPTSHMDENIRFKAYWKIYNDPSLSRYNPNYGVPLYGSAQSFRNTMAMGISTDPPMGFHPISIIVKAGHIILEGVVDNESDKTIAGMLANQVPGVFSVTNNLVVAQQTKKKK